MSSTTVTIVAALIGVLGVIVGTVVGFALGEWATRQREARSAEQQNRNLRVLLHREIEEDRRELQDYLFRAAHQPGGQTLEGSNSELVFQKRRRLVSIPPPTLSHVCWESQLAFVPKALTEQELRHVFAFYADLARIDSIRVILTSTLDTGLGNAFDDWKAGMFGVNVPFEEVTYNPNPKISIRAAWEPRPEVSLAGKINEFLRRNQQTWLDYEGLINGILQRGNPLPDPSNPMVRQKEQSLRKSIASHIPFRIRIERTTEH